MDNKTQKILISVLMVVSLIALMDIFFMNSGLFGTVCQYMTGNYMIGLWPLFYKFAIGLMIIFSFAYYFFFNKDVSESLSILAGSYIFWRSGASDILFFWLNGKAVPATLPWLNGNFPINLWGTVTSTNLYLSVILGGIITYFTVRLLKDKF